MKVRKLPPQHLKSHCWPFYRASSAGCCTESMTSDKAQPSPRHGPGNSQKWLNNSPRSRVKTHSLWKLGAGRVPGREKGRRTGGEGQGPGCISQGSRWASGILGRRLGPQVIMQDAYGKGGQGHGAPPLPSPFCESPTAPSLRQGGTSCRHTPSGPQASKGTKQACPEKSGKISSSCAVLNASVLMRKITCSTCLYFKP